MQTTMKAVALPIPALLSGILLALCLVALLPGAARAADSFGEPYSREELAQMLAPIALYPDTLLSQILMASTYPIEVIEADRWVRGNASLRNDALDRALLEKEWDPSVKAVCHFPAILALMSERIAETTDLGNAFLAQEDEVMAMIQELRAEAYARGNLNSTSQQRVVAGAQTIVIEPADTRVVYVPYYDPMSIYGAWWYPAYRPYSWGPPGVRLGFGLAYWPGVYFGFSYSDWCSFDWHRHHIHVDAHKRPRYARYDHWYRAPGPWSHAPGHRHGVAYRDRDTARRFSQPHHRTGEYRGDARSPTGRYDLERDRNRRGDERPGIDRSRRGGSDPRLERGRVQEQPRMFRDKPRPGQEPRIVSPPPPPPPLSVETPRAAIPDDRQKPAPGKGAQRVKARSGPKPPQQPAVVKSDPAPQKIEADSEPAQVRAKQFRRSDEGSNSYRGGERNGVDRQERRGGGPWGGREQGGAPHR